MADPQFSNPGFSDPLLQRFFMSPAEKMDKIKGKSIVRAFYSVQTANDSSLNFFKLRNARWIELALWAKGSQKISEFLDYMNVSDANKSYLNIDTTQARIAPQFVGTLQESMAKNKTYPCVKAIDDGSLSVKQQRLEDALFRMHDVDRITAAQQASGLHLEPPDAYVPDDEISARVHYALEDQLPKEITFEEMLKKLQVDIKFERVTNRKTILDLIVFNAGFTKIERLAPMQYTVRKCIATNMVYNFFMNDTGEYEITEIGEFWNIKVKDFRERFGKSTERPDGLTEKEIFELAKLSTNKNIGAFNYMWNDNWALTTYNQQRPYDDSSILVFDCEIDCGEDVYYVEKIGDNGKPYINPGKSTPQNPIPYQQRKKDGTIIEQPKAEGTEIIKKRKNTWMRGVYAPYGDKLLYWGRPDLIIQQYTNTGKPLSSYTVNIPNNDGEYVPSLFERGMEVLREYQLTKLKRKQMIAKIKPSGIRIDIESARNIDLGNGDTIDWLEVMRIYDQTGNEVYSSKGVDPLQRETPPLSNTVHDESIEKIIGLTNVLAGMANELRQLWGVPQYRDGSDVGDRTAAKLSENQNESSYNVTDFITNANNQLWEETFYKVCLLHWNDIVKTKPETDEDMLNTRFDLTVKTRITEYEKELLEQDIQRYSQVPDAMGNPSITLKDAMTLRELDDFKLANWYLAATVAKNQRYAEQQKAANVQQTAQAQQASNAQTAQNQMALEQQKHQWEMERLQTQDRATKENSIITGLFMVLAKTGGEVPTVLQPMASQMFQSVMMDVVLDNAGTKLAIHDAAQQIQAQQAQDQQQQAAQQQQSQQPQPQAPNQPPQQQQPQQ